MHRTKALCREPYAVPKTRWSWGEPDVANLKVRMTAAVHPKIRLDPNTPVPTQSPQMPHQFPISKAPVGKKDHLARPRNKRRSVVSQLLVDVRGHHRTAMLDHTPDQRHGSTPVDHAQTHHAGGIPPQRGIQSHLPRVLHPSHQRRLNQRAIQRVHLDLVVSEPTAKPAYRTVTLASSTHHIRCPGTQAHRTGVDQAHHHPGPGLQVAKVQPMRMLAKHAKQSIIQIRRVLHQSSPRQDIVLSC